MNIIIRIAAPYSMAFYGWSRDEAITRNGFAIIIIILINLALYMSFAFTRLGKVYAHVKHHNCQSSVIGTKVTKFIRLVAHFSEIPANALLSALS